MQGKWLVGHWCFGSIPTSQSHLLFFCFSKCLYPCLIFSLLSALSLFLILFCPSFPSKSFRSPPCAPAPHTSCGEGSNSQIHALHLGQHHMKSGSDQFWRDCLCPRLFFWRLCVHKSIHGLGLNESIYTWPREECQQFESLSKPILFWLNCL